MSGPSWTPNAYPKARRSDHTDTYRSASKGAVTISDPYRWLEHYSEETDEWTSAQEAFSRSYIDKYPLRQRLEDAFFASQDYARFSTPVLRDDNRWYWWYNSGLQAQPVYYRSRDSELPDGSKGENNGEVFFDPNLLTEDGTASLAVEAFSDCGQYYAYGISYSGSDSTTVYVRPTSAPLATKEQAGKDTGRLPEELNFVKFSSLTWTPDSKGFFYQRYPDRSNANVHASGIETKGDVDAMVYYHRIGTLQSEDTLVYYDKATPDAMYHIELTRDRKYVGLTVVKDSSRRNLFWIAEFDSEHATKGEFKWNKIVSEYEAEYELVANDGPLFYLRTNRDAPKYKVVTIDISETTEFEDFIPESAGFLNDISSVNKGNNFAVVYKRNVKDEVYVYSKDGHELVRLVPDFIGSVSLVSREKQEFFWISMTGFTTPGTRGRYDFTAPEGQRWSVYSTTKVNGLNPDDFESQQVWYESKDGTKIPMFIVRHKDTPFDGTAPAIQYGYGGFSISIDPSFNPTILTFLRSYGAIYAVANIRGGGEFGEDWHKAGYREKKSNCFDDFIAATEYLVQNKYAAPGKVTINGGSNGGLLVSACVIRAPVGTFGAAVSEVGVHDLLRFHRFTIGKAWVSDYGNPDDPHDFDFIRPISPLHNVPTDKLLPPLLLSTADHDDRVVPMHSFKLAATLQHFRANNPHPILLRVDKKSGHGAGKSTKKKIQEAADKWSFVAQALGLEWKGPV